MSKTPEELSNPLLKRLMAERDPAQTAKVWDRMLLAAKIDDAIKAKGWKKKDLAQALGKEPSVITKWLSGTHNFRSDTLTDIGYVLQIHLLNTVEKPKEVIKNYHHTIVVTTSTPSHDIEGYFSDLGRLGYSGHTMLHGNIPN